MTFTMKLIDNCLLSFQQSVITRRSLHLSICAKIYHLRGNMISIHLVIFIIVIKLFVCHQIHQKFLRYLILSNFRVIFFNYYLCITLQYFQQQQQQEKEQIILNLLFIVISLNSFIIY